MPKHIRKTLQPTALKAGPHQAHSSGTVWYFVHDLCVCARVSPVHVLRSEDNSVGSDLLFHLYVVLGTDLKSPG